VNLGLGWHITSFYRFLPIDASVIGALQSDLTSWAHEHGLRGLVLLAPEGINGTVAGEEAVVFEFKDHLASQFEIDDFRFKNSFSQAPPFRRMDVEIRKEIVGLKRPDLAPLTVENGHLSARDWHAMLNTDQEKMLIDTRNQYETLAGKFKGAIDPNLDRFSDWGKYLDRCELPRDVPIMIYCTGGIRCEKAILELRSRGFEDVVQLRDGILGYLAEYPNEMFEGDCFVFDDRVTVGQDLLPTGRFGICPGCGLTSDVKRECEWCGEPYFVCSACEGHWKPVCSKTCRDRFERHGGRHRSIGPDDPCA
jgi:UPF0176 protein